MEKIIEFKVVKTQQKREKVGRSKNWEWDSWYTKDSGRKPCPNPIVVNRAGKNIVALSFRLDCFEAAIVENSVGRICHAQWELYKAGRSNPQYRQMHVTYLVRVTKNSPRLELDELLTQVVSLVTKEVYSEEVSAWGSKVDVAELAIPYAVGPFDGMTITHETVAILQKAGMKNAYDVARNTRESLCKIPGMTTKEVFKLEKSLASRGLYLNTASVPNWKE